jgi:hypothetical protein
MNGRKGIHQVIVGISVMMFLTACGSLSLPLNISAEAGAEEESEEVVESFYRWYLDYVSTTGNPLVDQAYHQNDMLSQAMIQRVDEIIASFDQGGYDPFLCAQDVPESIEIVSSSTSDGTSLVNVMTSFGNRLEVELIVISGEWKIHKIQCDPK